MREISDLLRKYNLKPSKYHHKGKTTIVETNSGSIVIKPKTKTNETIAKYLESRNFDYRPQIIDDSNENYEIMEYIDEYDIPNEQKILDMIDLVSLLHNKTTHYKDVTEDYYKELFEDLSNNTYYLVSYYNDIISVIENKVYMSPSEYLLARNISKIYASLEYCRNETNNWYELVKDKKKARFVVLHNNLDMSHFMRNKNSYLISWDKSKIDNPIFDLYKLYRRHGTEYDFSEIIKRYEQSYPLLEDERKLLFILIAMPNKLEFTDNIYNDCKKIGHEIDLLYKTETILSPYYAKNGEENTQ